MLYTVVHMNLHTFFERLLLLNKEAIRDLILLWILNQLFDNKIREKRDLQKPSTVEEELVSKVTTFFRQKHILKKKTKGKASN